MLTKVLGEASSMYKPARAMKEDTINERGDFWHPDPDKDLNQASEANQRAREDRAAASKPKSDPKKLRCPIWITPSA